MTLRLNWGCGGHPAPGWFNSDLKDAPGVDHVGDVRDGLPLAEGSVAYAASVHALCMISYPDLEPVLRELRRVLQPGGTLRLVLPDLDKAIAAYLVGDRDHFLVPSSDEDTLGGQLIAHLLWYGYNTTLFTTDFAVSLLERSGYSRVDVCDYLLTKSDHPEIVELDNREHESIYIEGVR